MSNENEKPIQIFKKTNIKNIEEYSIENAIREFEELKNIALNCYDKNGNPNIQAAIRALENKAKIAGFYNNKANVQIENIVQMEKIKFNGEQLKLNIGEELE